MKALKRFLGGKKKKGKLASSNESKSGSVDNTPPAHKQNSKKIIDSYLEVNKNGDRTTASKNTTVNSQPIKASEIEQDEKDVIIASEPKLKLTETKTKEKTGNKGVKLRNTNLDQETRAASAKMEEKINRFPDTNNATASFSHVKKVDEVVVPQSSVEDRHATISRAYDSIPLLEQNKLPRGGISIETAAVGRVQFGIPPETIKDSMRMGIPVPQIYIVPAERFCRDMGPALGVNLAEFEFPGYYNFFVKSKICTLVVDSQDAEDNICRVFEETLLGPKQFRRKVDPIPYEKEDFAPNFPTEAIPNFEKELGHFRDFCGSELTVSRLLAFCHFKPPADGLCHDHLGVPPNLDAINDDEVNDLVQQDYDEAMDEFQHGEELEEGDDRDVLYENEEVPKDEEGIRAMEKEKSKWSYGKARWVGDVATVWPQSATEEEKRSRSVPRVEIFKMPSGTEYIIHDINKDNIVIGRARISGNVKVNETMSVEGFGGNSILDDGQAVGDDKGLESLDISGDSLIPRSPPSFYPPSFGVTTLGNSHGFDPSGSVSGYVLWINGRGLMIDPPPYSSATLEREGIRPRTIVGIILTHCHSDHDAGAFQKILTGSPVVIITTPTIYKSFIRKYAALASLSPALLRHCHRYKPAMIGQDLRFQGASFKFFYSLHAIPCVGFKVEWRGRSIVFSGDHLHLPVEIRKLQAKGILSKARAEMLLNMPLQDTDLLLHEAGAPPIHTPIAELDKLPQRVKKRMYVVHSSTIPEEFDLRKAPTGTAGTLRLDELQKGGNDMARCGVSTLVNSNANKPKNSLVRFQEAETVSASWDSASSEYLDSEIMDLDDNIDVTPNVIRKKERIGRSSIVMTGRKSLLPLVSMRPTSNTDSWYMLNLLQAVPFLTSLPYISTMEVLESARVEAVCKNEIVVEAARRNEILCVIWEGTCVERNIKENSYKPREKKLSLIEEDDSFSSKDSIAVWHSGDWTGPLALQPEKLLSGESDNAASNDIVATSKEGVKVITLEFSNLHRILKNGSPLYRKYLKRQKQYGSTSEGPVQTNITSPETQILLNESIEKLNILELIDKNSALRKLTAVQKRHFECLAEGPVAYNPGERLWRAGAPVDKAFLVVAGTSSFVVRRKNSVRLTHGSIANLGMLAKFDTGMRGSKGESELGPDLYKTQEELCNSDPARGESDSDDDPHIELQTLFCRPNRSNGRTKSMSESDDFDRLSKTLKEKAELVGKDDNISIADSHDEFSQSSDGQISDEKAEDRDRRSALTRRRSSRARFVNKVLVRLCDRRAFTGGLVFSKGHFLGDVSKMVAGLLSTRGDASTTEDAEAQNHGDESLPSYGFGEKAEPKKGIERLSDMIIHEKDGEGRILHTSTLTAGPDGCIVLVFPKETLTGFLDGYPGLLLSLLGTQVIV